MPRSHSFGNPRYQRGEDSSSSPVNELAALAQIFSGLQAPQQRQQEAKQQQALQFLQLMQQGSHQDDVLALQKAGQDSDAKYRADNLASQDKHYADQSGQFWGGTLPAQYSAQANTDKFHDDTLALQTKQLGIDQDRFNGQQMNEAARIALAGGQLDAERTHQGIMEKSALLGHIANMPNQTPMGFMQTASNMNYPEADKVVAGMHDALANTSTEQAKNALGPIYFSFEKNPAAAQKSLEAAWAGLPQLKDPATLAKLQPFINAQNAALYQPEPEIAKPQSSTLPALFQYLLHR